MQAQSRNVDQDAKERAARLRAARMQYDAQAHCAAAPARPARHGRSHYISNHTNTALAGSPMSIGSSPKRPHPALREDKTPVKCMLRRRTQRFVSKPAERRAGSAERPRDSVQQGAARGLTAARAPVQLPAMQGVAPRRRTSMSRDKSVANAQDKKKKKRRQAAGNKRAASSASTEQHHTAMPDDLVSAEDSLTDLAAVLHKVGTAEQRLVHARQCASSLHAGGIANPWLRQLSRQDQKHMAALTQALGMLQARTAEAMAPPGRGKAHCAAEGVPAVSLDAAQLHHGAACSVQQPEHEDQLQALSSAHATEYVAHEAHASASSAVLRLAVPEHALGAGKISQAVRSEGEQALSPGANSEAADRYRGVRNSAARSSLQDSTHHRAAHRPEQTSHNAQTQEHRQSDSGNAQAPQQDSPLPLAEVPGMRRCEGACKRKRGTSAADCPADSAPDPDQPHEDDCASHAACSSVPLDAVGPVFVREGLPDSGSVGAACSSAAVRGDVAARAAMTQFSELTSTTMQMHVFAADAAAQPPARHSLGPVAEAEAVKQRRAVEPLRLLPPVPAGAQYDAFSAVQMYAAVSYVPKPSARPPLWAVALDRRLRDSAAAASQQHPLLARGSHTLTAAAARTDVTKPTPVSAAPHSRVEAFEDAASTPERDGSPQAHDSSAVIRQNMDAAASTQAPATSSTDDNTELALALAALSQPATPWVAPPALLHKPLAASQTPEQLQHAMREQLHKLDDVEVRVLAACCNACVSV
jgi:hypothetical protein